MPLEHIHMLFLLELLQSLFMQSPFALAYHEGNDFRLNIINEKSLQTIGKTLKEVIGKTPEEVVTDAKEQGFIALLEQVYTTGIAFEAKGLPRFQHNWDLAWLQHLARDERAFLLCGNVGRH